MVVPVVITVLVWLWQLNNLMTQVASLEAEARQVLLTCAQERLTRFGSQQVIQDSNGHHEDRLVSYQKRWAASGIKIFNLRLWGGDWMHDKISLSFDYEIPQDLVFFKLSPWQTTYEGHYADEVQVNDYFANRRRWDVLADILSEYKSMTALNDSLSQVKAITTTWKFEIIKP